MYLCKRCPPFEYLNSAIKILESLKSCAIKQICQHKQELWVQHLFHICLIWFIRWRIFSFHTFFFPPQPLSSSFCSCAFTLLALFRWDRVTSRPLLPPVTPHWEVSVRVLCCSVACETSWFFSPPLPGCLTGCLMSTCAGFCSVYQEDIINTGGCKLLSAWWNKLLRLHNFWNYLNLKGICCLLFIETWMIEPAGVKACNLKLVFRVVNLYCYKTALRWRVRIKKFNAYAVLIYIFFALDTELCVYTFSTWKFLERPFIFIYSCYQLLQ